MPKRPTQSLRKSLNHHQNSLIASSKQPQYGSPFLDLPYESLTHITSYLPPPSLFALALTCQRLCEHVDDDNTWQRAFLNQFLGINPEHELENGRVLLLKRTESTWRKEFIFRYELGWRWRNARCPTVTHSPQHSSIDTVHLMSEYALLTSSLQYGIVARSVPINGKVLKGYIDASGTGLGVGNPNVEFTPDVSACAISSDGGTARVFWGKRSGEVALTVANRVMDSRAASKFIRCGVNDQHEGAVRQLVPGPGTNTFLSAGADGRIKLWDTKSLKHLWTSDQQRSSLVVDPFIGIAGGLDDGFAAGVLQSGDILIYDLHESETLVDCPSICSSHQVRISQLIQDKSTPDGDLQPQFSKVWLYRTGDMSVMLFVHYSHHSQFYRIHANVRSRDVAITSFGDNSFGNVSAIEPIISTPSHDNMLIIGDTLGFISIYDADIALHTQTCSDPVHRFEAHTDGAVAAISWSPTFFATGSAHGTTVVWDSLMLEPVRYFTTPASRPAAGRDWDPVSRIFVGKELVVVVVGNRISTWRVGQNSGRGLSSKKRKLANSKNNMTAKGHQQYEMSKDIAESFRELEYESTRSRRTYGREREQRSTLETLGLSELEAVQYVLMLSREEEEARHQETAAEEGVFEGDFDDIPSTPTSAWSRSTPSTPRSHHSGGRHCPRLVVPTSNEKVQVSPPFVPEPMEAGTSISPLRSLTMGSSVAPNPMMMRSTSSSSSLDHFPAISSSLSSTSSGKGGTSASPRQSRSAWSTPLKSLPPSPGPSSPPSRAAHPKNVPFSRQKAAEEMDDDLKLAIELSLAEARSRGENV